ncbi:zinc finger protein 761-like [Leptopilina boulardi]|uniref:zinc finger protein 761-like n=1 Tax=Leptopilina boulardi TaxID=63433 RepID=UPI0021F64CFD|nr:zinc finger protein 761-like [Leptopilina boulardi]
MFIVTKKIDSENISKLCRTCLREDNDKMVCLFVGPSGSSLAAKLRSLSCLEVCQGDGLPEKMCDKCVTRAESALLYREQCRVADRALRQALLKVKGMTSYTTVSGCKLYQQNQGFVPLQNAQKTLKCVECGAVFMNYQELCLHNRLHVPLQHENNIPSQHMRIAESQNSLPNLNHAVVNSTNLDIDNVNEPSKLTIPYLREEDNLISNRAACALHCSLCNHTFTNRTQLIHHNLTHDTNNINLVCNEETIENRQNSKFNIPSTNSLVHSTMEKSLSNFNYPFHSFMNENNEIQNSIISDTTQLNSARFQSDIIIHSQNNSKMIEQCFDESNSLKYKEKCHLDKLEDSNNKIYKCEQCSQEFFQKSKLETHCLLHTNLRPFKCFSCEKSYASKSKLNAHIRLHTKSNIYQCKFCNKIFTYPSYLEEHMNSHKTNSQIDMQGRQKIYGLECNICKKKFRFAKNLNAHFKLHSGKGLFECSICDKKFSKKYNLKIHLQSHDDKKLHKCKYCDKSFTQKSNLVEHTRIHTKVKPFQCNMCNKRFSQSSHLKSHKASHDTVRQHHCQLCGKKFKLSSHLKRHLNSHNGSKTYKCDKCNQMFSQAFSLKRHLKRHAES